MEQVFQSDRFQSSSRRSREDRPRPADTPFFAAVGLLAALFLGAACCKECEEPPPEEKKAPVVAQIALEGLQVSLRRPGELEFTRAGGVRDLEAGTSIRSEMNYVVLNVAGSIQVQLSPLTEMILIGPTQRDGAEVISMGFQRGQVRINSLSCDRPVILETPVGTAKGISAHFTAKIGTDDQGAFELNVQALTEGIVLITEYGTLPLPLMGRGYIRESAPPKLLPLKPYR